MLVCEINQCGIVEGNVKKMHSLKKEKGGIVKCTRLRFHCGNELQPLGRKFLLLSKGTKAVESRTLCSFCDYETVI